MSSNVNYSYTVKFEESGTIDAIVYRDVDGIKEAVCSNWFLPFNNSNYFAERTVKKAHKWAQRRIEICKNHEKI